MIDPRFASTFNSSLEEKFDFFNKELTKSNSANPSSNPDIAALKSDVSSLKSKMTHLSNITMQMKTLTETVSAQLNVFNANTEACAERTYRPTSNHSGFQPLSPR